MMPSISVTIDTGEFGLVYILKDREGNKSRFYKHELQSIFDGLKLGCTACIDKWDIAGVSADLSIEEYSKKVDSFVDKWDDTLDKCIDALKKPEKAKDGE